MKKFITIVAILCMAISFSYGQIPLRAKIVNQIANGDTLQWYITPSNTYMNSTNPFNMVASQVNLSGQFNMLNYSNVLDSLKVNAALILPTSVVRNAYNDTILDLLTNTSTRIGYNAGRVNKIGFNTFIGRNSGYVNQIGNNNVFIGDASGYLSTASQNTLIGASAGAATSTGGTNTFIGYAAGLQNTTGTGSVMIGNEAGVYEKASNSFYIHNGTGTITNMTQGRTNSFMRGTMTGTPATSYIVHNANDSTNGSHFISGNTFSGDAYGDSTVVKSSFSVRNGINAYTGFKLYHTPLGKTLFDVITVTGTKKLTLDSLGYMGINLLGSQTPSTWLNIQTGQTTTHGISLDGYSTTTTDFPVLNFKRSLSNTLGTLARTTTGTILGAINAYAVNSSNTETLCGTLQFNQIGANGATYSPAEFVIKLSPTTSYAPVNKFFVGANGRIALGDNTISAVTTTPSYTISMWQTASTIGVEKSNTSTAGQPLTISAGGTTVGGTADLNGGMLSLVPGQSKGTGYSSVRFQRNDRAATTGTVLNTTTDAMVIPSSKFCADNTSTDLFNVAVAAGTSYGVTVHYTIKTSGPVLGNESHTEAGTLYLVGSNDGAITTTPTKITSVQHKSDAGTYTVTFAASAATPSIISVTADSDLNVTSVISYVIVNSDGQTITQL